MKTKFQIKRVYEKAENSDGYRVLVDRVWPRGMTKEAANIDVWFKELAPSTELRKWFGHDPNRWLEFEKRYQDELKKNEFLVAFLAEIKSKQLVTLVYSAKDELHNQALVLQSFLQHH
ncbi:MAG: DUF488 domain-containing protein [Bacteroidetes bacterium]|nr:DUF488 domain-containing protein [Bacteroidota bacterium]MBS1740230.1 DUF488 domain-containing protein [Bacteroidota bacterium]MBS1776264.1 DUF488 domain-containing protein [Bacteroidota bacterium]